MQKKNLKKKVKVTKPVKPKSKSNMSLVSTGVAAATGLTTTIGCLIKLNALKRENKKLKSLCESDSSTPRTPNGSGIIEKLQKEIQSLKILSNTDDSEKLKTEIKKLKEELENEKKSKKDVIEANRNLMIQLDMAMAPSNDNLEALQTENKELKKQVQVLQGRINSVLGSGENNIQVLLTKTRRELEMCNKELEKMKTQTSVVREFTGKVRRGPVF